jgi:hypothetical protein
MELERYVVDAVTYQGCSQGRGHVQGVVASDIQAAILRLRPSCGAE